MLRMLAEISAKHLNMLPILLKLKGTGHFVVQNATTLEVAQHVRQPILRRG